MSEEYLEANLRTLERLGARGLAHALDDVVSDGEIEWADRAVVGVSLRGERGLVRMHGRRDPVHEAARGLPDGAIAASLVVVIGAGAGFVLDALEQRGFAGRVLVVEPSASSLRAMLSRRSWESLVSAGRLRVLACPGYDGWMDLWSWVGATEQPPPLIVNPVLGRERPDDVRRAADVVKRLLYNANANESARKTFAGPYLLNTLANLRQWVASRDVGELFGCFAGVPAFVLAAGPSLNRNLEELKPHRDGALVIAVDTALRPCLADGVEPDLVVGVDPGEANLRHLTIGTAPSRTYLVAEPSLSPGSFDAFGGRVFTFRVDRHHPWPWLQEQGIDRARLLAWGSVLTTAVDLAVKLGCEPVVFFGADFAYTDGQPYCRGTAYEEDWAKAVASGRPLHEVWRSWMRQPVVVERGIDGREVETSAHLLAFRDWVEEFCGQHGEVKFVNGTGAGVLGVRATLAIEAAKCPRISDVLAGERGETLGMSVPTVAGRLDAALRTVLCACSPSEVSQWPAGWVPISQPLDLWLSLRRSVSEETGRLADASIRTWLNDQPTERALRRAWEVARSNSRNMAEPRPGERRSLRWVPAGSDVPTETDERREAGLSATAASVLGPNAGTDFRSNWYLHFNARRLEHLATLDLDVAGKTVLEVGAGIGDLTTFFTDRGCRVLATDGRAANVEILGRRFREHPLVEVRRLVLDPPPVDLVGSFDIVFCYGLLYHLSDPADALAYLAGCCDDVLLVETVVNHEDAPEPVFCEKDPEPPTVSMAGTWSLATREWIAERLAALFRHVYVPASQPNHTQFPIHWRRPIAAPARAIFVASRQPIDNAALVDGLPLRQRRR